jgi:hypothetical protein
LQELPSTRRSRPRRRFENNRKETEKNGQTFEHPSVVPSSSPPAHRPPPSATRPRPRLIPTLLSVPAFSPILLDSPTLIFAIIRRRVENASASMNTHPTPSSLDTRHGRGGRGQVCGDRWVPRLYSPRRSGQRGCGAMSICRSQDAGALRRVFSFDAAPSAVNTCRSERKRASAPAWTKRR